MKIGIEPEPNQRPRSTPPFIIDIVLNSPLSNSDLVPSQCTDFHLNCDDSTDDVEY